MKGIGGTGDTSKWSVSLTPTTDSFKRSTNATTSACVSLDKKASRCALETILFCGPARIRYRECITDRALSDPVARSPVGATTPGDAAPLYTRAAPSGTDHMGSNLKKYWLIHSHYQKRDLPIDMFLDVSRIANGSCWRRERPRTDYESRGMRRRHGCTTSRPLCAIERAVSAPAARSNVKQTSILIRASA